MLNRAIESFVIDILVSLEKIKRYSKDYKTSEAFIKADLNVSASVREFEVIGEAMKHILNAPDLNYLVNKNWRSIINFRNRIAHEYFKIRYEEVFKVIHNEMVFFEEEFMEFLRFLDKDTLMEALLLSKEDLAEYNLNHSIAHLTKIQQFLEN